MKKIELSDRIVEMYESGMSCRQIGFEFGCSWSTVAVKLKDRGVRLRNRNSGSCYKQPAESNRKRSLSHKKLWDARGRQTSEHALHLQRAEWKARRLECYERDGWKCQECGRQCLTRRHTKDNSATIQAHHIVPRRDGGGDKLENLVTLCMSCHHRVERQGKPRIVLHG